MRPQISDKLLRRLSIPELSGGVNYRDGISQVLDDQLTDCRNVWYRNGILKTRPGIQCLSEDDTVTEYYENTDRVKIYAKKENFRVFDGQTYFLVAIKLKGGIRFAYYPENPTLAPIKVTDITEVPSGDFTCNIFQHNADIYCFCSGYYEDEETPYYIFKITETSEKVFSCTRITDELSEDEGGFYVPTVIYNVGPVDGGNFIELASGVSADTMLSRGAVMIEGYNLLGKRYKAVYSTAAEKDTELGSNWNRMIYPLIHCVHTSSTATVNYIGETVVATITNKKGEEYIHRVKITSAGRTYEWETDDDLPGDELRMFVSGRIFGFYPKDDMDNVALWTTDDYVRNNMVVTAPCPNSKENYEKVLNMTCAEWFGGGSEGIYDGIHLFMGGNTKESEKALVCWSDFDKPLYFSENGYAYVGDKAQRVTAFGKQGESLVIFKERETYATQYVSSDSVTEAEAVINQSVVDITAAEVTFPMVQVHGFIGCDCPNTVQLCRNRLVWAHSDGKVYTLVSANQYNERSIFEVSAMVQRRLEAEGAEKLRSALSADWEGHYVLSLGDSFYLMDYNSYGYANVTSYTKSDDAQLHIPWWVWDKPLYPQNTNIIDAGLKTADTPIDVISLITAGGRLYLWTEAVTGQGPEANVLYYRIPELMCFDGEDDMVVYITFESDSATTEQYRSREVISKEIPAMAQTKLFDFGGATVQKSVPKAEISFGNNEGVPITVTTITDRGETVCEVVLDFEETDERNPRFFKNVVIRNGERLNNRVGFRLESCGNLFVDALAVYYKILGGSR